MADSLRLVSQRCNSLPSPCSELGLSGGDYLLATIHRAENTDIPDRLCAIFSALNSLEEAIILPLHPRTRNAMESLGIETRTHIHLIEPTGYCGMIALQKHARMILTDSGGIQKEAYWLSIPCITLRHETEWVETVAAGWNLLVGTDPGKILSAVETFHPSPIKPLLYGDVYSAEKAVNILNKYGAVIK
jgi:UDP-N-acetylglucosamine 2-epimerase